MHPSAPGASLSGQTIPVLLNPAAGSDPKTKIDEISAALSGAGVTPEIRLVEPDDLVNEVRRCVQAGAAAVAVGGGDGTISSAVDALVRTNVVLIPLPLGTLNHFATRYGLASLDAVAHALTDGCVITIPVGTVNGNVFVNNASCGYYPHVVRHRDRMRPVLSKWPAAAVASLMVAAQRPLLDLELTVGGNAIQRTTAALWIGIGRHSLRLPEPGDAEKEGSILELVMPRPHSRLRLLILAVRLLMKLKRTQKAVDGELEVFRVPQVTLRSKYPIDVAIDGEVQLIPGPLQFRYEGDALRVLSLVAPDNC